MGLTLSRKLLFLTITFLPIILIYICLPWPVMASHKIFREDFSSTNDGEFPNGWILTNEQDQRPCFANWHVHNGMAGIVINQGGCSTNIMPSNELWNDLGNNYIFELDMQFVAGTDHNVAFRFTPVDPKNKWYEIHFQSPGDFVLDRLSSGFYKVFLPAHYPNGKTYHIKIIVNLNNIKIYVDNALVRDYISFNDPFPAGRIALRAGSGSNPISETYFDNIVVTSIDSTILDVPLFKQTAEPWQSLVYDTANLWSIEPTIYHWGSALTSAAMIFNYNGLTKLPDGTALDPGTLNTWLNSQPDGYIGEGYLNWLSLSRLSKLAKASGNNPNFLHDALEYRRIGSANIQQLNDDIESGRPDILEEPGHFIVGRGITQETFAINDPFHYRYFLTDGYDNSFLSLGRYIPSDTDLSYIMLVTDEAVDINVRNPESGSVGEQFVQQPLKKNGGQDEPNGPPKKIFYLPKPTDASYNVTISSANLKTYNLQSYLYDRDGNVKVSSQSGVLGPGVPDAYTADFDWQSSTHSSIKKVATFQSMRDDVSELANLGLITKDPVEKFITHLLDKAEEDIAGGNTQHAIRKLEHFIAVLDRDRGNEITEEAYQIMVGDANYLINLLL